MPEVEDSDHSPGDLIAYLVPTDYQAPNLARKVTLDPLAESRMLDEALGCRCQRRDES
jgi:hypothetical protein